MEENKQHGAANDGGHESEEYVIYEDVIIASDISNLANV